MIKACSFLPAATQMIYDMKLQHTLKGVTFECPWPAREEKAVVVRCVLEGHHYSSAEIDKIFSASKAQGKTLYYIEEALLQQIQPDVVFTQDVCEVCQIDTVCTAAAINKLSVRPEIVPLTPSGLQDVFLCAITIGKVLNEEEKALRYVADLQQRIDNIVDELRRARTLPARVMVMEWINPIYNCGHWIPDQVALAGGIDMLGNPKGDSVVTPWEKIVRYDPEVLIIAPCGFETARTKEEIYLLTKRQAWNELQAVKNDRVFIVDYDLFTQPSASTLVSGIEVLAALFHPQLFSLPEGTLSKVVHVSSRASVSIL
jgi:iron complex transport system substrate-binding protein